MPKKKQISKLILTPNELETGDILGPFIFAERLKDFEHESFVFYQRNNNGLYDEDSRHPAKANSQLYFSRSTVNDLLTKWDVLREFSE